MQVEVVERRGRPDSAGGGGGDAHRGSGPGPRRRPAPPPGRPPSAGAPPPPPPWRRCARSSRKWSARSTSFTASASGPRRSARSSRSSPGSPSRPICSRSTPPSRRRMPANTGAVSRSSPTRFASSRRRRAARPSEITAQVGEISQESGKVLVSMESGTLEIREGREVIDTVRRFSRGDHSRHDRGRPKASGDLHSAGRPSGARGPGRWSRRPTRFPASPRTTQRRPRRPRLPTQELTGLGSRQMAGSAEELAKLADGLRQNGEPVQRHEPG